MLFLQKLFLSILFFILIIPVSVLGFEIPNKPVGFVNDFANLYSADFRNKLETNLENFNQKTTVEISVTTIPSLDNQTIEEMSTAIFEKWKIGKKGKDNGLLLLISKNEHKVRIEVGYGLEPIITDGRAGRIIREQISPRFKAGNFEDGTWTAISQIEDDIASQKGPDQIENLHNQIKDFFWPVTKVIAELLFRSGFIILIFPLMAYLGAFLGRSKDIWPGGLIGGILGLILGLVFGTLIALLLSTVILSTLGLFLDYLLSKNYKQRIQAGHPTDFWSSGGGFWGGGGGGGFSGFGGGSSGGGGASGDW